jgi:hypothetical protein
MKTLTFVSVLTAFLTIPAHAQTPVAPTYTEQQLVEINSEEFPNETYHMGFNYDANGKQVGLYYADQYQTDPANRVRNFSFTQLADPSNPPVLITRSGYNIVEMSYQNNQLTILFKQDARKPNWNQKIYSVACDGTHQNCNVVDSDTHQTTNSIYITSHRTRIAFINVVVGIDAIESR